MITKFVEATQNEQRGVNHGKFMLARFTPDEWARPCVLDAQLYARSPNLLHRVGWSGDHLLIVDLQTGEGAMFLPGGYAHADLEKHQVWVCPMFEPFLTWLYQQDLTDLGTLPDLIELPDAPAEMVGYRRKGTAAE